MNRQSRRAVALMELIVALAIIQVIFAASYATVHASLGLHRGITRGTGRCELADLLTTDFRRSRQVEATGPASFSLMRADGTTTEYHAADTEVVRTRGGSRTFSVRNVKFSFWDSEARVWTPAPTSPAPAALRVEFADAALIIGRDP